MTTDFIDPTANPEAANAQIAALLADEEPEPEARRITPPTITLPPSGLVNLTGGFRDAEGLAHTDAVVVELTGEHEERIAKARATEDFVRFIEALLVCGVESIGGKEATKEMLDSLLIGDRDRLLLAISEATFGSEVELGEMLCPSCEEVAEVSVKIEDIPSKPFNGEWEFDVALRDKRTATVRLATGADQAAYLAGEKTGAERNSILLSRCVLSITAPDGSVEVLAGMPSMVRTDLGIVDRRKILDALSERQPGPQYDEVTYTHDCGNTIPVSVGLMHLFQGL